MRRRALSDRHPGASGLFAARYRLTPLQPARQTLRARKPLFAMGKDQTLLQ